MATPQPVENQQLNQGMRRRSSLKRQLWNDGVNYGVAIAFVLIALVLMLALDPYIQVRNNTTFLLFYGAVMLAGWYGGRNAGILATLLSAFLATYFFVDPIFNFYLTFASGARILIFVLQGGLISVLFEQLRTAQQQSKRSLRLQEAALCEQQAALRELQKTEAALRDSEARFQGWVSNLPGMVYRYEPCADGVEFTYVSSGSHELTELSPETILQDAGSFLALIHPDDLPAFQESVAIAVKNSAVWQWEGRIITPSGQLKWIQGRSRPQQTEDGEVWDGLLVDITERQQAQEDLRLNRDRLAFVLDNTGIGLWLNSLPLSDLNWDNRTREFFFVPPDVESTAELFWSRLHPADREPTHLAVETALRDRTLYQIDHRAVNPDTGEIRWIRSAGKGIYAPDGTPIRFDGINYDITDRKQAEAEREQLLQQEQTLRQQAEIAERRLYALLESIREDFVLFDRNWHVVYLNSQAATTMRKSHDEILGRYYWDLFPDLVGTEFYDRLHQAMYEQTSLQFEYHYEIWDTWFENRVYPSDEGIIVLCTNITERKQTEQALRQAEERLRVALQNAPITVFNQDHELKYTWIYNPILYDLQEMLGKHDRDFLPPEDAEPLTAIKQRVLETGIGVREDIKVTRDRTHYYDLTVEPLRDEKNTIVGITCAAIDVSELKQSEINLRESEDRLRMALESAQLGTWDWNLATNELVCDTTWKALFGLPADAQTSIDIFYRGLHPAERNRVRDVVQRSFNLDSGGHYDAEYRTIGIADGIERWVAAKGQVYFNSNHEPVRFIGTVLNITERKRAEATRLRLAEEREQLLAHEQAAREAAEAANRIKDEFLAVVSHELRSPLNPILGWAKLLRSRQLDAQKTDRALEVIERNAQMQAQLINDLLDVSRILRGKLSLDAKPIDLVATIQAAMETVRLAAEAKAIDLRFTILDFGLEENNHPKSQIQNHKSKITNPKLQVLGDAGRLQQVIWNLLTNAVKFTFEGGRVDIRLEHIDSQAQITVTDTGKGIPPDFLPYVFEQFRQESSATTCRFGGLGLGLAIVRYLVELHGGTVQADSPGEGQGATFTIKLPLVPHQPITEPNPKPAEFSLNLQGIRILVVDDDDNTREFLAFLLELHGANVIATATATEALTALTQFKPDVLLSDIGMPDVDGYMLMRQVRALPPEQGGTIPAIALTAYAGEINQQQALSVGFQHHVPKPVEPEVLIQAIASLLEPV
jgi:PAS domain S-box-containing protein